MKRIILLLALVALAGAMVATHVESCDLMHGVGHANAITTCPAGLLPIPLVLWLVALSIVTVIHVLARGRLVLISVDRPPRRSRPL